MKTRQSMPAAVQVTLDEVAQRLPRTAPLNLRISHAEKQEMKDAATAAGLTVTDYILACHRMVAPKILEAVHAKGRAPAGVSRAT